MERIWAKELKRPPAGLLIGAVLLILWIAMPPRLNLASGDGIVIALAVPIICGIVATSLHRDRQDGTAPLSDWLIVLLIYLLASAMVWDAGLFGSMTWVRRRRVGDRC
jgi:hypothetical protein